MLQLCSYEVVALGSSKFCPLFTKEDFQVYEQAYDISVRDHLREPLVRLLDIRVQLAHSLDVRAVRGQQRLCVSGRRCVSPSLLRASSRGGDPNRRH